MTPNALTVDVEDYFHVSGFADRIRSPDWDHYESRVVASTRRVLQLFDRHAGRATFFILGWVARRHPELVREIDRAGHEIGCHSEWHRLIYDLDPEEFRRDTCASRDILQDLVGRSVTAYRAPSFSITSRSLWALTILAEEGFTLDASIFPVHHDRYGLPHADRAIHRLETTAGTITEFPSSVCRVLGQNIPAGGGGYLRLYPYYITAALLRQIQASGRPAMVYLHPWEVDPDQPRLPGRRMSRFRHYVNLHRTESRLDRLLSEFSFDTVSAVVESLEQQTARPMPTYRVDVERGTLDRLIPHAETAR